MGQDDTPSGSRMLLLNGPDNWSEWERHIQQKLHVDGYDYVLANECPPDPDGLPASEQMKLWQEWVAEKKSSGGSDIAIDKARWRAEAQLAHQEWDVHNRRAFLCIMDHCNPILRKQISHCGSASEAWAILKSLCPAQDHALITMKTLMKMTVSQHGGVREYAAAVEDCVNTLRCDSKIQLSRFAMQLIFLVGLEDSYPELHRKLGAMDLVTRKELKLNAIVEMIGVAELPSITPALIDQPKNVESAQGSSNSMIGNKRKWDAEQEEEDRIAAAREFLSMVSAGKGSSDSEDKPKASRVRTGTAILQMPTHSPLDEGGSSHETKHLPARRRRN